MKNVYGVTVSRNFIYFSGCHLVIGETYREKILGDSETKG